MSEQFPGLCSNGNVTARFRSEGNSVKIFHDAKKRFVRSPDIPTGEEDCLASGAAEPSPDLLYYLLPANLWIMESSGNEVAPHPRLSILPANPCEPDRDPWWASCGSADGKRIARNFWRNFYSSIFSFVVGKKVGRFSSAIIYISTNFGQITRELLGNISSFHLER